MLIDGPIQIYAHFAAHQKNALVILVMLTDRDPELLAGAFRVDDQNVRTHEKMTLMGMESNP